tara:strand:+ start:1952 stop:2614 length:663 start_codon:yes stop_codon:yes gene_type:complete
MAATASPFGLRPTNMIGGAPYNGGAIRHYHVKANNSAAIFNGDLVALSTAGLPAAVSSSPTGIKIPATAADATAGIVGVMVGARYIDDNGVQQFRQFLPANATTSGFTEIKVMVNDDPRQLFKVQGNNSLGTFNSGTGGSGFAGAVGKNGELDFSTSGSTSTGNSGVSLKIDANGSNLAVTSTFAVRIIDVVEGTEGDNFPEFIVKFNVGVHSYDNSLGI